MKQDKLPMERSSSLFRTLSDKDWAESITRSRTEPNLVLEAIKKKIEELKKK